VDVGVEQGDQRGRAGHHTDLPAGALLEGALVAVAAAVGPFLAGVGLGAFDVQFAPAPRGQRQVVLGEADRFLGSQRGVVQAAEEGDQPPAAALLADGVEQRANLLLAVGAAAAIAQTGIPASRQAIAYAIFAIIGTLGVGAPVGLYFAMGKRSADRLGRLKDWMGHNNAVIMAVLCLVIGMKLLGDGVGGLSS
jgi:hypothetical protein